MKIKTEWEIGEIGMVETIITPNVLIVALVAWLLGVITTCIINAYIHTKRKKEIKRIESLKTNFRIGDVVQTQYGWDRGLVTKVNEKNMPIEVMASYDYNPYGDKPFEPRYYGGVEYNTWYKTGEHMTVQQWHEAYSGKDGWDRYCRDRQNQVKYD